MKAFERKEEEYNKKLFCFHVYLKLFEKFDCSSVFQKIEYRYLSQFTIVFHLFKFAIEKRLSFNFNLILLFTLETKQFEKKKKKTTNKRAKISNVLGYTDAFKQPHNHLLFYLK